MTWTFLVPGPQMSGPGGGVVLEAWFGRGGLTEHDVVVGFAVHVSLV